MSQAVILSSGGGGGGGITSVNTDSGPATPAAGVLKIITNSESGSSVNFTGSGNTVQFNISDSNDNTIIGNSSGNGSISGLFNTAVGISAFIALTSGQNNVAFGVNCLEALNTGSSNIGIGQQSLQFLTSGSNNTAIGLSNLRGITTGASNIAIGTNSGANYIGPESNNILIGNLGVATTDSGVIKIGTAGTQNRCFVSGIRGVTTANANAIAVLIDSAGQLGTVSSSARYKDNIKDMADYSSDIMQLRPVTFNYKTHSPESISVGLIAEEVELVAPQLVVYKDGVPETVKYHDLPILLLQELQKLRREFEEYKRGIQWQRVDK